MSELPEQPRWPSIPGWWTIFTAVFVAGLWIDSCTSPLHFTETLNGHKVYKIVHSPRTKEVREGYGKVIFVTASDDERDKHVIGNLFMCKVSDQAFGWAEYMDTIQLLPSECTRVAP